jgi:hydrogenase-4 component E
MMVTRKTALMQVLGFMLMENGVFMTAVSTTLGMPLVVEMGIFLDVLVGVGIMGLLSHRINDKFASIETTKLNSLKG